MLVRHICRNIARLDPSLADMNASQFGRWLRKQGIEISNEGKGGHKALKNPANGKRSVLPTHGGAKQLGTGLMEAIKKDLGLK